MLARVLLFAGLVASAACQGTVKWSTLPYPSGNDKHLVQASSSITLTNVTGFPSGEQKIAFELLYRSGDKFGKTTAAALVTKKGLPVYEWDDADKGTKKKTVEISNNPDFTSILRIGGKIFSITQFEQPQPGVSYLAELKQDSKTGKLSVKQMKPLDFSAHGGVWVPCAGSVTPWETHIGSEEYEPDARKFYKSKDSVSGIRNIHNFMRYWDKYVPKDELTKEKAMEYGFYPYRYGYPWETKVNSDFSETTTKLYSHGRQAYEMSYVMPDLKTVYGTDDGTNVFWTFFKAYKAKDLTRGKNYCAKFTQTSEAGGDAKDFTADIEWIEMPTASEFEVKSAIEKETFMTLFDDEECKEDGTCPTEGFKSTNTGGKGCMCLKVKKGKEKLAGTLEKRHYAGMLGCTTEFRKREGITYDPVSKKMWTAISEVSTGMEDGHKNDLGTPNHIKLKANKCGCVMEFDVGSDMRATKARMLTCGTPNSGNSVDKCSVDGIASPDNVAYMSDMKQLLIGEDTSSHQNDLIWVWDFVDSKLTRVASTPYGSETTSPYWYGVGMYNYATFVVQHPYGESDQDKAKDKAATGKGGWIGYIGPIKRSTKVVVDSAAMSTASASATLIVASVSMVVAFMAN